MTPNASGQARRDRGVQSATRTLLRRCLRRHSLFVLAHKPVFPPHQPVRALLIQGQPFYVEDKVARVELELAFRRIPAPRSSCDLRAESKNIAVLGREPLTGFGNVITIRFQAQAEQGPIFCRIEWIRCEPDCRRIRPCRWYGWRFFCLS